MLSRLEGELLGDGSLVIGKRYKNAAFRLQARDHGQVAFVCQGLRKLGGPGQPSCFTRQTVFHETPVTYWQWRSWRSMSLTRQRHRWYPNGEKVVPADFTLTPEAALHWYVGDGSLRVHAPAITLCTDGFGCKSVELLINELQRLGFHPHADPHRKSQFRIRLGVGDVEKWLDWIGPCPIPSMAHKWSPVFSSRRNPPMTKAEKHRIEDLYAEGVDFTEIAQLLRRPYHTVYSHIWRQSNACVDSPES